MADQYPQHLATIGFKIAEAQAELKREEELCAELDQKSKEALKEIEKMTVEESQLQKIKERLAIEMEAYAAILRGEKRSCELLSRCKHSLVSDLNRAKEKRDEFGKKISIARKELSEKQTCFEDYFLQTEKGAVLASLYKQVADLKAEKKDLMLLLAFQEEIIALSKTIPPEKLPKISSCFTDSWVEVAKHYKKAVAIERAAFSEAEKNETQGTENAVPQEVVVISDEEVISGQKSHAATASCSRFLDKTDSAEIAMLEPSRTFASPASASGLNSSGNLTQKTNDFVTSVSPSPSPTSCLLPSSKPMQKKCESPIIAKSPQQQQQQNRRIAPFSSIRSLPVANKPAITASPKQAERPEKSDKGAAASVCSSPPHAVVSPSPSSSSTNGPTSNVTPAPANSSDDFVFKKPFAMKKTSPVVATTNNTITATTTTTTTKHTMPLHDDNHPEELPSTTVALSSSKKQSHQQDFYAVRNIARYIKMLKDALNIHGFAVVRLAIPNDETTAEEIVNRNSTAVAHYLYLKEHVVKRHHPSKPQKRTLFVCNVPPYLSETDVKAIFEAAECGHVEKVFLHLKPEVGGSEEEEMAQQFSSMFPNPDDVLFSTRFAYVVFRSSTGVEKAMKLPHDKPLVMQKGSCKTGVEKWCDEYRQSIADFDLASLEKEIETYVGEYDKKKQEADKQEKVEEQQDGDGWVKVSRKRGARFTEAEQQFQHRKEKKRKEEQELVHFYRFQLRESRREKIAELRQRFEEDKQRIALLRQQRKFKPF